MAADVALPDGFQLDGELPQGFQLDQPSLLAQEGYGARPVLRAARDVASGVAGAVDLVEKPVRLTIAEGLDAAGLKDLAQTMRDRASLHDTVQKGFDAATGGLTAPKNIHDKVSDFVGELATPGVPGISKVAEKASTAAKAVADLTPKAKSAEDLVQLYKDGRQALQQVDLPADKVQAELVTPIQEALKSENPGRYGKEVTGFLDELKSFGRKGVNANFLESFRQDLSQLPSKFAQPIRDAIDNFYQSADLPVEFRNAYAVMKRGETLQNALTKAGDSLTKQRNAINSFLVNQKGLTDFERQSLESAGKASTPEALLRIVGSTMKPFGYFGSMLNLPAGITTAAGGELLKSAANKIAQGRISKAVEAVKGRSLEDLSK